MASGAHFRFIDLVKSVTDVPQLQQEAFSRLLSEKSLRKGENFVDAGDTSRTVGFVRLGLFRYFYTHEDGTEFTKGFFEEGSVLSSYSSILENRPSYFTIQAMEDAVVEVVQYEKFNELFDQHPCWNRFLVALLQKAYVVKEAREREFLLLNAEQRYQAFLQRYPGLEKRIKQHIIASYLGIAPESLSRLRNKAGLLT